MNCAIVDDFPQDRQILSNYLTYYCRKHHILIQIHSFPSGESLLKEFQKGLFDLIFLDIYLEGMDGMQVAQHIRKADSDCLLIFSTTSAEHAVKSYRVRAFDYLLKPFDYAQFEEVFQLCDQTLFHQARYIEVKEGRLMVRVLLRDLIYTDYSNHYIQLHTKTQVVKTYLSFAAFADMLLIYPQFLCCYRNCIVNMDEVGALDDRDFLMKNGERVPIARAQSSEIRQKYVDYTFKKLDGE